MPASTSITTEVSRRFFPALQVISMATTPNAIAVSCTATRPPLSISASAAPKQAPDATPSVSGDTSGLESSACIPAPATDSPPPTSSPSSTRGRRTPMIMRSCGSTDAAATYPRLTTRNMISSASPRSTAYRPTERLTAAAASGTRISNATYGVARSLRSKGFIVPFS